MAFEGVQFKMMLLGMYGIGPRHVLTLLALLLAAIIWYLVRRQ